jgi:hypothetical protein
MAAAHHLWGWWAILALLLAAAGLAVWQVAHQQTTAQSEQRPLLPSSLVDWLHLTRHGGPLVSNLPARNPNFTGRTDLLHEGSSELRATIAGARLIE